jgi:crossover junction endodeoxyribonuclease RuvC
MQKKSPYRILGIDPGTNLLGFGVLQIENKQMFLVELGTLSLGGYADHHEKLRQIFERLQALIERHNPREVAIEAPFFGKNVQSMLKLGRAQGVAIAAAMTKNLPVTEYSPKRIKQSVTGNGNASKEQVSAMLETLLKTTFDQKSFDATDALGAAVCHFLQSGSPLGSSGKRSNDWGAFLRENPDRKL